MRTFFMIHMGFQGLESLYFHTPMDHSEMALAHFGRGTSHPPKVPLEAVFNSLKAGIGGI